MISLLPNPFLWKENLKYLVSWKGYPGSENSWIPHYDCSNSPNIIQEFYDCNPTVTGHPKLTLAAMKLPPAHKSFSLSHLPDSGIVPQAKAEGYVMHGHQKLVIQGFFATCTRYSLDNVEEIGAQDPGGIA
ncbi:hypothetical protein DSO57_1015148 [Entomophthora muscae]|uniref:Uncharacterized protein n=1 Tax=Entomophthora muscae TaxID=34485 RepID=A0ACC2UQ15_9FUNG|nr:hypothetical protein DSO57_1015148 [Entomophthora muscae]